ncbi:hypothetical protein G6F37_012398 [Rhizopus arrhizus]|nr:hypothetical protein G6F38_012378 [Rhizopus arrhizus]KAG1143901.1 hypothetical protein G6F37_012398 [Rhizopus arrhizus]
MFTTIPRAPLKQICRNKLEKLQQGNLPSRQFKALFESIILELPKDTNLPTDLLRSIYLKVMNPRLRAIVLPNLNSGSTWAAVADLAISMDEVLSADPALAYSQLHCDSSQPAYQFPPQPDPNAMEIDAFNMKTPFSRQSRNSRTENKKANQFNQWVRPGVPLCGHCGKEGHLSKRCYQAKRNKNQIQALETTSPTGSWSSYSTEPIPIVLSSKTTGVNYATIPECQDPILTTTKGTTQDAIHSLAYLSQANEYREGPRLSCAINGLSTSCLIDIGATISALRSEIATALNLVIDSSQKLTFTTATGEDASTLGCAAVLVRLGEVSLNLNCHVVDRLAHPLIIGFNDLKTHKATIDTATGSVKFPGLSSFTSSVAPGSSTASSNFVAPKLYLKRPHSCSVNEALKLPGHH